MAFIPKIDEMIEAADDSGGGLTCGVEIEFLVPSVHLSTPDPDPDIEDQHLYRTDAVNAGSVKKEIFEKLLKTLTELCGERFRSMDDDKFLPPHRNVVDYSCWRLGRDITVAKGIDDTDPWARITERPYQWTDCELTSPVMDVVDYEKEVEKICRALKTIRIHLNRSTAVHVHVGRGDQPFSLLTVMKFATLYWFTEKAIMALHHPSRRENSHCFLLTEFSDLAKRTQDEFDLDEPYLDDEGLELMDRHVPKAGLTELQRRQLRQLWGSAEMPEIAELMRRAPEGVPLSKAAGNRGSVGFRRFQPEGKTGGNTQTFEWRHMASTLDAQHINQWIMVCMQFTDFCRLSTEAEFKKCLQEIIDKGADYSASDLLMTLCPASASTYTWTKINQRD
ncbi:putative amidoligase enzyme-domain-containing protein [Nemania sp. NC0429]|nr:putative amidoligase enzyme-domain-containing protein [Nemania sp. NC0429]